MAEQPSAHSPASDFDHSLEDVIYSSGEISCQVDPGSSESDDDENTDRLLKMAEKYGDMPTKSKQNEIDEEMEFGPQPAEDKIKQSFYEFTRINDIGLIEIDIEKLERKFCSLSLGGTTEEDPFQRESYVQSLREKVLKHFENLEKDNNFVEQTELEEGNSTEEEEAEKLTPFKYERKNKLWDRNPHLKKKGKEFLLHKFCDVNFTKGGLEALSKGLINHVELELNRASNILRRIAYPKLCEKHLSSEFPSGALAEDDEPLENINLSVDHIEFLHKEIPITFLEELKTENFQSVALDLERDPQINNKVPSIIEFLKKNCSYQFSKNCFTLILAVLKNPYRKLEVFYDHELPVVNEQVAIAEYLLNSLLILDILHDKDAFEKLTDAVITFAGIHNSFQADVLTGFMDLLSKQIDDCERAKQIYCKVLNLMISIGATFVGLCLPEHFEKISCLADKYENCELYFHLLRACEISIANNIKHESWAKAESCVDLSLFYTACHNYFGRDLTIRLIPVFKKYENRKYKVEQYVFKKYDLFPTKDGYMDMNMWHLTNMSKSIAKPKSLIFPEVNESTFNYAGKVLFGSSNAQFGYVIQEDMYELSDEDHDYWTTINELPLSYFEGVTGRLTNNNSTC